MTGSEVSSRDRRIVYERDGDACVVADGTCTGLGIQHRINRGMGGSLNLGEFAFLLTMCTPHNVRLETDAAFAAVGRRLGWKLETWEDVYTVAVFSPLWGGWRLLDGVGGFRTVRARDMEQRARLDDDRYAEWRTT